MLLIPNLQLCLAHFCEVHGPTPLMVTEGVPIKCNACGDYEVPELIAAVSAAAAAATTTASVNSTASASGLSYTSSPSASTTATAAVTEALRKMNMAPSRRSSPRVSSRCSEDSDSREPRKALQTRQPNEPAATPTTAVRRDSSSPCASSRDSRERKDLKAQQQQRQRPTSALPSAASQPRTDSSSHFRKTYDDSVTKRAIPCDNCAMTVPSHTQEASNGKASSTSSTSADSDARNPTLRTRAPCARVFGSPLGDASPHFIPSSSPISSSTSSDTEAEERSQGRFYDRSHRCRTGTMTSTTTSRSSTSSSASRFTNSHTHYCHYISTHEPLSANAYYIIRASCLRTLTLETLPRSPVSSGNGSAAANSAAHGGATSSVYGTTTHPSLTSSLSATSYFSPPHSAAAAAASAAAAANGGPLFFGDPSAGYTTAHVFRVNDVHARGHKRVYALIALSTHRERLAMKAFGFVSAAFNDLATWIQQLADAEAERVAMRSESASGTTSPSIGPNASAYSFSGGSPQPQLSPPPTQPSSFDGGSGSSFLAAAGNGLSRRMGPGFAGFGGLGSSTLSSLRPRGLPEILGMPDFFIELHARFVSILLELSVLQNL